MEHIEIWKARKAKEAAEHKVMMVKKRRKEALLAKKFRKILNGHGVTEMYTNGYVYEFEYKGWIYQFVNQECRLCCTIRRPFLSKADGECFRDMENEMMGGKSPSLVSQYGYKSFIIDAKPMAAFKRLLRY